MSKPDINKPMLYEELCKLRAMKEAILIEADRLEWQGKILRTKTTDVDNKIARIMAMIDENGTAMVKYTAKEA